MKYFPAAFLIFLSFPLVAQWGQGPMAISFKDSNTGGILSRRASPPGQELYDSSSAVREIERMISYLVSGGHLAASVDSQVYENGLLEVYLYSGRIYKWGNVRFEGLSKYMPGKRRIMRSFRSGNISLPGEIAVRTGEILSWYENTGFPFARLQFSQVIFRDEIVDAVMQVIPGEPVRIDSIILRGEARLNRKVLYRKTGVSPGSLYSERKIRQLDRTLNSLPYLTFTRDPGVEFRRGGADLYLFMENQRANQFSGMLGLMTDHKQSGKLVLTGDIQLGLRNPFAWGEELFFAWKKSDLKNQELNASLSFPHIPGTFLGLETRMDMFRFDSLYLNLDFRLAGRFIMNQFSSLKGSFERKSSTIVGELTATFPGETLSRLYGLEFEFNSLDDLITPGRGLFFGSSVAFGNRDLATGESQIQRSNQMKFELLADAYLPLSRRTVLALRSKAGFIELFGKEKAISLLETELYRLGGISSIRGFDENSILASQFGIATAEYHWLFDKGSSIYLFSEMMPYSKKSNLVARQDIPFGFGFGSRLSTRAGMFSISYALGTQQGNPINLKSAKIHMGYVSRF